MKLFDAFMLLNDGLVIEQIHWNNPDLETLYGEIWNKYLNQEVRRLLKVTRRRDGYGTCRWENEIFSYELLTLISGQRALFLKKDNNREFLLEQALDMLDEGVQIYDENACVVYLNSASRNISQIPASINIKGRHLLDIYELDENVSTSITALKTGQRVLNRVDHFYSNEGAFIATANSGFPVIRNGKPIGVVTFEQTQDGVSKQIKRMQKTEKALSAYHGEKGSKFRFTGYEFPDIIGSSPSMQESIRLAQRMAKQDCSILLVGETGTGKEMFAQSIHKASPRHEHNFLAINCAAVPAELIEGLLFGTTKGSFTGSENRTGYFEEANGGTLFLDELNSMSLSMQSKILRALQEKKIRRVGGTKDIDVDVRVISSCNEDPFQVISENRLRKDLFYRLSTVMIDLPPLREHKEDIPALVRSHIAAASPQFVNAFEDVDPDVLVLFQKYDWPGNVRELFHVLDYAMNIAEGDQITLSDLPKYMYSESNAATKSTAGNSVSTYQPGSLQANMDQYEEQIIRQALHHFGGNITQTAAALDIKRQSLQYRIRKYGIIV